MQQREDTREQGKADSAHTHTHTLTASLLLSCSVLFLFFSRSFAARLTITNGCRKATEERKEGWQAVRAEKSHGEKMREADERAAAATTAERHSSISNALSHLRITPVALLLSITVNCRCRRKRE